jgi:hypothetical protein
VSRPPSSAEARELVGRGDAFERQLFVDDLRERLKRLCAGEETPIDEESGGAGDPVARALFHVRGDGGLGLPRIETRVELLGVQGQCGCVADEGRFLQVAPAFEQLVVILPELALLVGTLRSLMSQRSVLVECERKVPKNDANVLAILLFDFLKGRTDP